MLKATYHASMADFFEKKSTFPHPMAKPSFVDSPNIFSVARRSHQAFVRSSQVLHHTQHLAPSLHFAVVSQTLVHSIKQIHQSSKLTATAQGSLGCLIVFPPPWNGPLLSDDINCMRSGHSIAVKTRTDRLRLNLFDQVYSSCCFSTESSCQSATTSNTRLIYFLCFYRSLSLLIIATGCFPTISFFPCVFYPAGLKIPSAEIPVDCMGDKSKSSQ